MVAVEVERTGLDPAELEEVVDQLGEALGLLPDGGVVAVDGLGVVDDQQGRTVDDRQGLAQSLESVLTHHGLHLTAALSGRLGQGREQACLADAGRAAHDGDATPATAYGPPGPRQASELGVASDHGNRTLQARGRRPRRDQPWEGVHRDVGRGEAEGSHGLGQTLDLGRAPLLDQHALHRSGQVGHAFRRQCLTALREGAESSRQVQGPAPVAPLHRHHLTGVHPHADAEGVVGIDAGLVDEHILKRHSRAK